MLSVIILYVIIGLLFYHSIMLQAIKRDGRRGADKLDILLTVMIWPLLLLAFSLGAIFQKN